MIEIKPLFPGDFCSPHLRHRHGQRAVRVQLGHGHAHQKLSQRLWYLLIMKNFMFRCKINLMHSVIIGIILMSKYHSYDSVLCVCRTEMQIQSTMQSQATAVSKFLRCIEM